MSKLRLTMACCDYDRTRALATGKVDAEGIKLNVIEMPVEEVFFRMLRHREFDIAELSLSSYAITCHLKPRPFVAIPVFPSRYFRHGSIFINTSAGISEPSDLVGKRVGVPEYQMTAPVWIRGILQDQYGVKFSSYTHVTGGQETPGRSEKIELSLPPTIRIERAGTQQTLARMLSDGEIDALFSARAPSSFRLHPNRVVRLFPEYQKVEQLYYQATGIFPIMHVVAIRTDIYKAHRWIAQSLMKAFLGAQRLAHADLRETAALKTMLPWLGAHVEETVALMGDDFWPYGLEPNRSALELFLGYHHEQGLSKSQLRPDDLFAPESLESFVI